LWLWLSVAAGPAAANRVAAIEADDGGVVIHTETAPVFSSLRLSNPERILVDIVDADLSQVERSLSVENGVIDQIATRQFQAGKQRVGRVMIGLLQDRHYEVEAVGNKVVVRFAAAAAAAPTLLDVVGRAGGGVLLRMQGTCSFKMDRLDGPPRIVVDLAGAALATDRRVYAIQHPQVRRVRVGEHADHLRVVLDVVDGPTLEAQATATAEGVEVSFVAAPERMRGEVSQLDVVSAGGGARIVLAVGADIETQLDDRSRKVWVLELGNVRIPESLHGSRELEDDNNVLRSVSVYPFEHSAKVVVNLRAPALSRLERGVDKLTWHISPDPKAAVRAEAPVAAGYASAAAALARAVPAQGTRRKPTISLDLQDARVVNVIRFIADISGENIITGETVTGGITLRIRDIPWDQALDIVLKSKGLDMVREGGVTRIAPVAEIQAQRQLEVQKKQAKEAAEDTLIKIVAVNYAPVGDISSQVQSLLSARGRLSVNARSNTMVIEDVASRIDRIVELSQRLDRETPQVLIEARIVEASSSSLQQLGIQWGGLGQATQQNGNATGLAFPANVWLQGIADDGAAATTGNTSPQGYAVNMPAPVGAGVGGGLALALGSAGSGQLLNLRLSAMEEGGSGRIMSSPRITTLDNQTATISQGIDIPMSTVSAAGTSTRLVSARLQLTVTPHVTNDGSVLMNIVTSKNEPDFSRTGGQGDPTLQNKEATTQVMVKDGETTVIGGIYTHTKSDTRARVPFFSHIPIVGKMLFSNSRVEDSRSELLIFVTPKILNRNASMIQPGSMAGTQLGFDVDS
jgi:type IV pilus assembly protein PilQ